VLGKQRNRTTTKDVDSLLEIAQLCRDNSQTHVAFEMKCRYADKLLDKKMYKKAVRLHGTTARCRTLVQKACTQSSGNALNWNKSKTVGKYGEVVEKPLYNCISERLMHVATWYHGTPGPKFTKFGE